LYSYTSNNPINFVDPEGLIGTPAENIALVMALGEEEAAATIGPTAARIAAQAIAKKCAQEAVKRQLIKKLAEEAAKQAEKKLATRAGDLVKGSLKKVKNYPSQLEGKTYGQLLKDKSPEAKLMRKLIDESERLLEKTSGKPK
jgi:RNase P protein component